MRDQFGVAAVMPVVAAIVAALVVTELHAVLVVTILVVVVMPAVAAIIAILVITQLHAAVLIINILVVIVVPVMMAADNYLAVVGLTVR